MTSIDRAEGLTAYRAAQELFAAGYDLDTTAAILAEADKHPSRWAYAPDRRRCAVKHMPSGLFDVADCEQSEATIAALRRRTP